METKKFTRLSLLLALSVVINLIEVFIPIFSGIVPGLKLGLANIVILFVLISYGFKDALYLSVLRVILVGILRTGLFSVSFFFSLGGALLSIIMMYLSSKYTNLSVIGISITGSIFHSIGQIVISMLFLDVTTMLYYLPLLLLFSIPTGIITGILSNQLIKSFKEIDKNGLSFH